MRNLILSGGIYHPFAETSAAIAGALQGAGIESEITGVAEGLARLSEGFDLVTFNCLAFSMTQAEKYAPLREDFAFAPDPAQIAAIEGHAARGGILGVHTAAISFDTWPGWGDLLGVSWVWGQSGHPMPDYVSVTPLPGHPITAEAGPFTVWDELYGGLRLAPDTKVLAVGSCRETPVAQPVLTAREAAGRAVWSGLGHDLTAYSAPGHRALLACAALWAARRI